MYRTWTSEEIEILSNNYNKVTNEELTKLLPNKSFLAIYKKAYSLGFRKTADNSFLNRSVARKGEKCCNWQGGRRKTSKGYIVLCKRGYPTASKEGLILEHRYIMEQHLGRFLKEDEVVHHKNGIKDDNRIENLEIMTKGEHTASHNTGKVKSSETRRKISESKKGNKKHE